MKNLNKIIAAIIFSNIVGLSSVANATESGRMIYPFGVNTVLNGIMPRPGSTQFYSYTQYYSADEFAGPDGNNVIPDFEVDVFVEAPRIMHTWEKPLGPFTVSSGAILPIVYTSSTIFGMSESDTDIGDIIVQPFNLGYVSESKTVFSYLAFDFSLPTGSYSQNSVANTGVNYASFMPSYNLTWFFKPGWELSASLVGQFNQKNDDTNYESGDVAMLDYAIGYSVTPKVQVGLQGFVLNQFSDDKLNGNTVGDGNRAKVNGIGPQIRYDFSPASGIAFKYQKEFGAENTSEGDKFWIQFSMPI
ncbi:transporter [Marinobacter sp. 71-i]|uniref:Transporter n=1 Tax=Marinobacter iranensis TaxID=2962607 RepID=A0ABT5YFZ3_9GAMM|nr:transporter [Marinobacter iranensis]MDF0752573.1 transporter [Marinobacter iranensis]